MSSGVKSGGEALALLLAGSSGRGLQAGSEHTRSSSMGQLTILQSFGMALGWDQKAGPGMGEPKGETVRPTERALNRKLSRDPEKQ